MVFPVRRTVLVALTVALLGVIGAPSAGAARSCKPVENPYPGTRYEGVDLTRILAARVSCRTARRVAKGAHAKALGLTPPADGIRRFTWRGWKVTGNLRPSSDRYLATKGARRVRWRF
jgi:hypothetical protein